jgi:hypothetical protein
MNCMGIFTSKYSPHTQDINSICSSFIFHDTFWPYIWTIIRWNTGTEGKVVSSVALFLLFCVTKFKLFLEYLHSLQVLMVNLELSCLLTLNLPTTTIVAQPFNVIKWQLNFNPVA